MIRARPSSVAGAAIAGGLLVWSRICRCAETIVGTLLTWHTRSSDRRRLLDMDDHTLRDIGASKIAVQQEAQKPFWRS